MKRMLLGACALIAVPVIAQTAPAVMNSSAPPTAMSPLMKADRVQSRADVVERTQRMFALLDANRDGTIDQAEMTSAGERRKGGRGPDGEAQRETRDRGAKFDRIDTNRDGSLSRDEFAKGETMRVERRIVMRDEGDGGRGERLGGKRGGRMGHVFGMADTNRDGRVTLQEATASALSRFDRMDTNRDGRVTHEERMAARATMREQRAQ